MTNQGRRNMGPPYSQAQLPGGSCRQEKKESAFWAEDSGVLGAWSTGRSYDCPVNGIDESREVG